MSKDKPDPDKLLRAAEAGHRALALLKAIRDSANEGVIRLEKDLPPGGPGDPTSGNPDKNT